MDLRRFEAKDNSASVQVKREGKGHFCEGDGPYTGMGTQRTTKGYFHAWHGVQDGPSHKSIGVANVLVNMQ